MQDAVLVSACRTPIGSFLGALSSLSAPRLGSVVISEVIHRARIQPSDVQEVIMGNVLTAGVGQAPARQAALFAGLPPSVECLTVNKVCGSGLKAVILAAQAIRSGDAEIIVAGGMESMSNVPFALEKVRTGMRLGHGEVVDLMIKDGLWDVYNNYHMGSAAELCARECGVPREAQDEFAIESYRRAQSAVSKGLFKEEIVPVTIPSKSGDTVVDTDEDPFKTDFAKIPTLKPVFQKDGTVTAANASKINDGAAALVVMSASKAKQLGLKPLARIIGYASAAKKPEWFTTAPVDVIAKTLDRCGLKQESIDLFEVNEAFAVVTLAVNRMLGLDPKKVNVHGGAVALGHPIGASGARILVTLLHALRRYDKKLGMAAICIGGGEASGMIVELL